MRDVSRCLTSVSGASPTSFPLFSVSHDMCRVFVSLCICRLSLNFSFFFFFFQAEDGIRDADVTGVQTCALPILTSHPLSLKISYGFPRDLAEEIFRDKGWLVTDATQAAYEAEMKAQRERARAGEIGRASCRERV